MNLRHLDLPSNALKDFGHEGVAVLPILSRFKESTSLRLYRR